MKTNRMQTEITNGHAAEKVSGSNRRTLEAVFRHPTAHNLEWNDVVAFVDELGDVIRKSNNEFEFRVAGAVHFMRKPHTKDITAPDVIKLRKFLADTGFSSESFAQHAEPIGESALNLLVIVDHHEAKIYDLERDADHAGNTTIKPYDPHHFLHHLTHKDQLAARGQRAPEDTTFYEAIASGLTKARSIILFGHGTGKSNAAHHLSDYLRSHQPAIAERIVRECVTDISSITDPKLLELANGA